VYIHVSAKKYGFSRGKDRPQLSCPRSTRHGYLISAPARKIVHVCVWVRGDFLLRVNSRTASVSLVALRAGLTQTHMAVTLPSAEPLAAHTASDSHAFKSPELTQEVVNLVEDFSDFFLVPTNQNHFPLTPSFLRRCNYIRHNRNKTNTITEIKVVIPMLTHYAKKTYG
jgi:hypothetical protein